VGTEVVQVGILVENVEETAKRLEKFVGIGPFRIFEPEYRDVTFNGKTAKFKVKLALANAGPVQIELVQPLQEETVFDLNVKRKDYGLHHLAIKAENLEQSISKMKEKGMKVIQSGNRPGVRWAYLDTEEKTGLVFELIEKK
jgi:hypothetical protein